MKKCLVIIASILMLINPVSAKDSAETNPNSISSSPDLEMYGQNIKGVNRVETGRVVLAGLPQSSSDAVSKGYVDNQISSLEGIIRSLQKIVSNQTTAINRILNQQQTLNNSINKVNQQTNSLYSQINSLTNQLVSLSNRVVSLENTPAPTPTPSCPTIPLWKIGTSCGNRRHWVVKRNKATNCDMLVCVIIPGSGK